MRYLPTRNAALAVLFLSTFFCYEIGIAQPFTLSFANTNLGKVEFGDVTLADVNRDGFMDVSIVGLTRSVILAPVTEIAAYSDEQEEAGAGGQIQITVNYVTPTGALNLDGVWMGSSEWSDFNGDGNLDLITIGATNLEEPYNPEAIVLSDGGGTQFSQQLAGSITGVRNNCMSVADFNGDGEEDVLVAGLENSGNSSTRLYLHDEQFEFVEKDIPVEGFAFCGIATGDLDSDGDHDFVISGITDNGYRSRVFLNSNNGDFFETASPLQNFGYSSVDLADMDGDGDLDLAIGGAMPDPYILEGFTELYVNDGNGSFSLSTVADNDFKGTFYGDIRWADFSNDGLPDLFISGAEFPIGDRVGRIYLNEEQGLFRHLLNAGELLYGSVAAGDYDRDGDVDLYQLGTFVTNQYRNDSPRINDSPEPPSNLSAAVNGQNVNLTWAPGSDLQTDVQNLRYNLYLTRDGVQLAAPLSNLGTGRRFVPNSGNMGHTTSWKLGQLAQGTYEWRVQTIDQSFAGSEFAEGGTFQVTAGGTVVSSDLENPEEFEIPFENYPNPFTDHITFELNNSSQSAEVIDVKVVDLLGRDRAELTLPAGSSFYRWDAIDSNGTNLEAGSYFLIVRQGDNESSKLITKIN